MPEQFLRTEMLIGKNAVLKLNSAHVAVFGLGGVGSFAVEALARAGIGRLTLIDPDKISESNINRQLIALHSTVGMHKTEAEKKRVLDINPGCAVESRTEAYLPENAESFFETGYDYIIDAVDMVTAKIDLAVRAEKLGIPIISCMGTGNKLDPSGFAVADIYETGVCPLCRVMRRELKARGVKSLKVVYSGEQPIAPLFDGESQNRRRVPASISFVPAAAGLMLAGEAVKDIGIRG
ncbi:MAG: tRNA threonylcarbamoyladenosine dehydratase [Oscillospiraceae bacterium]|nr:tRNA threonylcarbamoyladenosine dehydratase [Oscillospiraceae bacterium]